MFFKAPPLPPGTIIHYPVDFSDPGGVQPHFVVVTCCDGIYYDCFVIRTKPTEYQERRPILMAHLIPIDKNSHNFLEYDSLVSCAGFQRIRVQEVRQYLREKPGEKRGSISLDLRRRILATVQNSSLFSQAQKDAMVEALKT